MIRDYTDMMHMTPNDLAQYARENANGIVDLYPRASYA